MKRGSLKSRDAEDLPPGDPRPQQLGASHNDAVICDFSRWDGRGSGRIRDRFAESSLKVHRVVYSIEQRHILCVAIDKRALKLIMIPGERLGWVGAVDAIFDSG